MFSLVIVLPAGAVTGGCNLSIGFNAGNVLRRYG